MNARAAAAARTRAGIVEASIALYYDGAGARSTLEQIAGRAGVTVQTVLRHFGSRAALGRSRGRRRCAGCGRSGARLRETRSGR
jgi:AcrR family transcriptional regulator